MLDFCRPPDFSMTLPWCIFIESMRYFRCFSLANHSRYLCNISSSTSYDGSFPAISYFFFKFVTMNLFLTRRVPFEIICRLPDLLLFKRSCSIPLHCTTVFKYFCAYRFDRCREPPKFYKQSCWYNRHYAHIYVMHTQSQITNARTIIIKYLNSFKFNECKKTSCILREEQLPLTNNFIYLMCIISFKFSSHTALPNTSDRWNAAVSYSINISYLIVLRRLEEGLPPRSQHTIRFDFSPDAYRNTWLLLRLRV